MTCERAAQTRHLSILWEDVGEIIVLKKVVLSSFQKLSAHLRINVRFEISLNVEIISSD